MPNVAPRDGYSLEHIAELCRAKLIKVKQQTITGLCSLDRPDSGGIAFFRSGPKPRNLEEITKSGLSAILVAESDQDLFPGLNLLICCDPLAAFSDLTGLFYQSPPAPLGISPKAEIDPSAKVGVDVKIGAFVFVGADAEIGDNVTIYPNVTIYARARIGSGSVLHSGVTVREECSLGRNCTVHCGTVIGADGFGYFVDPSKGLCKVPQIGSVVVEDNVEIGANTCIDRGTIGETRIGTNTKIDNMVQIGHNNRIGSNTILCGTVALAGSSEIGNQVVLGGGVNVGDHITIVDGVRCAGGSGVSQSLLEKGDYGGFPAQPVKDWHRSMVALKQLPKILSRLKKLTLDE